MSSLKLFPTKPMSWQYVAAFLDGEGSIVARKLKGAQAPHIWLKWHQKMNPGTVLLEIEEFLWEREIKAYHGQRETPTGIHGVVEVARTRDVEICLRRMMPYLRVKRERAATVLDYLIQLKEMQMKFGRKYWCHTGYRLEAPGNVKGGNS